MFRSFVNKFKKKDDGDLSGDDEDLIVIGKHKGVGSATAQLQSIEDLAGKKIMQEDNYKNEYTKD